MAAIFAFTCKSCGKIHEGSPSYGFTAPDHYAGLSEEQKSSLGWLTSDLCTITHEGDTDHFIRAILEVPIHGVEEPFTWGLWVSLSAKSYSHYLEHRVNPPAGTGYFGWVCNRVPWYPESEPLATDVVPVPGGIRPSLFLHHGSANDHPLIIDQRAGISIAKAQEIGEFLQHGT